MLWYNLRGIKEVALRAAREHCETMDVQFLDDVVTLKNLWVKKNSQGKTQLWVSYQFEFSPDGEQVFDGIVILLGEAVLRVELEVHPY